MIETMAMEIEQLLAKVRCLIIIDTINFQLMFFFSFFFFSGACCCAYNLHQTLLT